jgi:hypothetical protein
MKKVWVQMAKLPSELRDFLTVWAIRTILGLTKDVDMIFTWQHNGQRMKVLVLDMALIPTSVDVVIGDNVYELDFRVEPEEMQEMPKPLDMVDDNNEFDKKEEGERGSDQGDFMQEDKSLDSEQGKKFSAQTHGTGDGNKGKKMRQLPVVDASNCVEEVLQ